MKVWTLAGYSFLLSINGNVSMCVCGCVSRTQWILPTVRWRARRESRHAVTQSSITRQRGRVCVFEAGRRCVQVWSTVTNALYPRFKWVCSISSRLHLFTIVISHPWSHLAGSSLNVLIRIPPDSSQNASHTHSLVYSSQRALGSSSSYYKSLAYCPNRFHCISA